jgi:hypothetical protein
MAKQVDGLVKQADGSIRRLHNAYVAVHQECKERTIVSAGGLLWAVCSDHGTRMTFDEIEAGVEIS